VLWSLASPADNIRGPQYLAAAMAALHRAFRRGRCELLIACHAGQVGLYTRTAAKISPLLRGQLQSAYPDLRIEPVAEDALAPRAEEVCLSARLRLVPHTASFVSLETFLDHQEHQLVDPLAGMFAALSSRRTEGLRPLVSLVTRPAGRLTHWRARRRVGGPEKLRGPLWLVDVRLAVIAPRSHRDQAIAKLSFAASSIMSAPWARTLKTVQNPPWTAATAVALAAAVDALAGRVGNALASAHAHCPHAAAADE